MGPPEGHGRSHGRLRGARRWAATDAELALVGPVVDDVSDDPEGREVLEQCIEAWSLLPPPQRRRVRLLSLPMDDVDENAVMVNALQRHATVIVQKSLAEGFGLTVAEGMWKAKAVVASAVGGIVDQVAPGTGVLLDDPSDLDGFGDTLSSLLDQPDDIVRLGEHARRHVSGGFCRRQAPTALRQADGTAKGALIKPAMGGPTIAELRLASRHFTDRRLIRRSGALGSGRSYVKYSPISPGSCAWRCPIASTQVLAAALGGAEVPLARSDRDHAGQTFAG